MNGVRETVLDFGKKAFVCTLAYLMIPLGVSDVLAQEIPPPPADQQQYSQSTDQGEQTDQGQQVDQGGVPPQPYSALSPDQIGRMVAPIALYPDSLVAQILAASTFPSQIVDADRFVQTHPGVPPDQMGAMADAMPWDPSVKALIAFPTVLSNLDKNLDWTSQLGNAYYNQPQDVMAAVQSMRQRAYEAGNLRPTPQLAVTYAPDEIVIAPVSPAVVYVPYYDPWVVYGAPVAVWGGWVAPPRPVGFAFAAGVALGFGIGVAIGGWNHWGWGWHNWGMGWHDHTVVYARNVYVSRSVTVVNHGYYGHFDRNPNARAFNRNIAMRAPNSPGAAGFRGEGNGSRGNDFRGNSSNFNGGGNNFNRGGAASSFNNRGGSSNFNSQGGVSNSNARGGTRNVNNPSNFNTSRGGAGSFNNRPAEQANNINRGGMTNSFRGGQAARPAANTQRPPQAFHAAPQSHGSAPHASGGGHPNGGGHH